MSAPDSWNPSIQYPDGLRLNPKDTVIGNGVAFRDAANAVRTVSISNPLPVSINGVTINVSATGLATQVTLAALLASAATSSNQSAEIALLTSILAALAGTPGSFNSANDFTVAVAGTAVQGANVAAPNGVILSALFTNTKQVYIGGTGVTNSGGGQEGLVLYPTQQSVTLKVTNLNQIWMDADVNGEGCGVIIL